MRIFIFCLFLISIEEMYPQILINEYSAANYDNLIDNYGDYEDWFELYNTSNNSIDLNGYYLSDKANNLTKFLINSSVIINSEDHLTIFASGRNLIIGSNIHTNFKIHQTKGNEWVILTAPDGITVIDSVFVLPCLVDQSRGRKTDGNTDWGLFTNPNPNENNTNAIEGYSETPTFSFDPGSYPGSINLEITCLDQNVNIYYTTNGNTPSQSSNLYNSPISINQTMVIKSISVSNDNNLHSSFMQFGTFFIEDSYTIPILSVGGNQVDNLLDGNDNIEPWGTFEYYKNGQLVDKATGEFNEHGNDSWGYPQRGFDFIIRDQFGYNYAMKNELFRTKNRDRYQRLIIKTGANDNYPFAYGSSGAHIRDSYVQSLSQIADLRMDERSYEPCILYLNGEYWGLYEIREKVDDLDFTDYYYDQDSVGFLKTWGGTWVDVTTDGQTDQSVENSWDEIRDFITTNDMSNQDNYNYAKSIFNMGSLIDYFILNTYVVNADWLNWNTAWWRGLKEDGEKKKWRYVLWDMDNTFDHGANYTDIPSQNPNSDPCDPEGIGNQGGQGHIPIWNALLNNETFFTDYINRWTDLSNSYFSCDFMIQHLDSLILLIQPEMPKQIERWGGNYNEWQNNVQNMRDFIETRCNIINSGILDCYQDEYGIEGPYNVNITIDPLFTGNIDINGSEIENYPFSGTYFGGVEQTLSATPNEDYIFDYWEFSNSSIGEDITNPTLFYELTGNESIIAHFIPNISLTLNTNPIESGFISVDGDLFENFPSVTNMYGETPIIATPEPGFTFNYWELSGGYISNQYDSSTFINITENDTLTAHFSPLPLELEILFNCSHNNAASITINNITINEYPQIVYLSYGINYEITSAIEEDFLFEQWNSTNTIINNPESESIEISFYQEDTITLNLAELFDLTFIIEPNNGGYVLSNGVQTPPFPYTQKFPINTMIPIEAIPYLGMKFQNWQLDNAIIETNSSFNHEVYNDDTIKVIFNEVDLELYIPNSFSPNADGINDIFKPICDIDKLKSYEIVIYNEWGGLEYRSSDIETGWEGPEIMEGKNNFYSYKIIAFSNITGSRFIYEGTILVL